MISVRLALCFAPIRYGRLESQISAFDDVVASQQPLTMSAADAKPNLLRLCAYVSGLQTNHKKLFFLSSDQRSLWWMTAQLPFEAYDQTTARSSIFSPSAVHCFAPDEHLQVSNRTVGD